ncbi:hypothetical protein HNQ08_000289 [Deinococcus humi]|uniref:Uncharacterized protein n=1 Tax=Deinococcus humi TaxID=662880 RepID=A0A7W8JSK0_9DEIO|nr:hypothetical protein [Deinococcus humi]
MSFNGLANVSGYWVALFIISNQKQTCSRVGFIKLLESFQQFCDAFVSYKAPNETYDTDVSGECKGILQIY